ncbi:MAG TPA: DUF4391 domain-containing protein, partial [Thermotogota bacterium]|nr:DUF4391 domain-containing protein [Thermotogota bacterium]
MLHFPPKTLFDRRVPKKKFYQNLSVSHSVERKFVEDIESITWKYKLAPDTLNLEAGTQVTEIQVFEIFLKGSQIAQSVLTVIDRGVPYHIIFLLRFNEMAQLRVSYKKE